MRDYLWQSRPWRAFKNFAIIFSFVMNLILLLLLLLAAPVLVPAIDAIGKPLVGGLSESFVEMGDARIVRTIAVDDAIPVQFDLPLQQTTTVVLTDPVPLTVPATMVLPGGGGVINGTVSLELPPGVGLPVALDMTVPVSNTIPVSLDVAVDIPLNETELGPPFQTLEGLFLPLNDFVQRLPTSNEDLFNRVGEPEPLPSTSASGPELLESR
jgi:hypothetical protein